MNVIRLCAAVLCLCIAACTKNTQGVNTSVQGANGGARANSWTVPHVLRYSTAEDISSLNPLLIQQTTLGMMSSLTMAWLVKWDSHNHPFPELATQVPTMQNGGVSKDGLTITYHLRKGVKWSDGAPFSADDVVWTYHAIMNPANNVVSRAGWDRITKVDEPDKYTVIFHLSKPYSPFIVTFFSSGGANPCILPKHLLAQYPDINHVAYNSLPVGIGPFKYKAWQRAQRVVMVANPLYWRGMPKLKEIDFEIIPDRNTVLTSMQSHSLDLWYPVPGTYYVGQHLNALGGYRAIVQPAYFTAYMEFNTQHAALRDPAVRHALELATDRRSINDKIRFGVNFVQEEPAPHTAPYYDPNIPMVPFDIAKANQVLDSAGWRMGPSGVRAKNGVALTLDFATVTGSQDTDRMIELLRTWWKRIGVNLTVKHYQSNRYFDTYQAGGILYGGKWDVALVNWGDDPIGDMSFLFACDAFPPNGQNVVRWCDPAANKAMHDLFLHYDQGQRNKDDAVVMEQIYKQTPAVVLYGVQDIFVFNKDLKSFHPGAVTQFDQIMDVDI
ncbi:MAG TPA: peptide ABC transporter substrate-binding protein, partial [Candidatus Baltobacteraceae bacterium]